jgi:hypothetical protein
MNYYYPEIGSTSKALWVMDAIASNDPSATVLRNNIINNRPGVFWGLVRNNLSLIKSYQDKRIPFYFTDMPYWNRYMGDNRNACSWRIIPNALHVNWIDDFPNDRFNKLSAKIKDFRKNGNHILVCPSSQTMNRFYNQENWLQNTINEIKKYTDRPIKIRQKPRNSYTSGPRAALISFEEDAKDAWAVVTSASIAGVEALCLGIPVFCTEYSPCASIANLNLSAIENPRFNCRDKWLNTLAYYQYTEVELRSGIVKYINDSFLYQQSK